MPFFLEPEEILKNLKIKDEMNACEFGCGHGAFSISLAKKLKRGKVFGLDVQEERLSALHNKARSIEKINNFFPIQCNLENENDSAIKKNFLDVVLIPNVLYQSKNKCAIINEASRILKRQGQLLIIDWQKNPYNHSIDITAKDDVKVMARQAGLSFKKEIPATEWHYGLLFTK